MHPFFDPLDDRETMLLLTTLTVGGSVEVAVFEHLPEPMRTRVRDKAQQLIAIPTEKRVTFMVHEMKEALQFKGLRGLERVDPSWILQGLKGESPRVVATILNSLPAPTVRSILKRLPSGIREKLPPRAELNRIPVELVRAVRQIFESRFHAMPMPSAKGFAFRDVIQLDRAEIYRLMRDLGLVELGQAFAAVGKMALAELCRRLPREAAEELILAVRSASKVDLPELKPAQRFLSRIVPNFKDTEEFFQKSGLWRLAKASLLETPAFRAGFRQRLPRDAGLLFDVYVEKASEMEEINEDGLRRLQDSVLVRIRELSRNRVIGASWATMSMSFHNPLSGEPASAPPPAEPGKPS